MLIVHLLPQTTFPGFCDSHHPLSLLLTPALAGLRPRWPLSPSQPQLRAVPSPVTCFALLGGIFTVIQAASVQEAPPLPHPQGVGTSRHQSHHGPQRPLGPFRSLRGALRSVWPVSVPKLFTSETGEGDEVTAAAWTMARGEGTAWTRVPLCRPRLRE